MKGQTAPYSKAKTSRMAASASSNKTKKLKIKRRAMIIVMIY